MAAWYLAPSLAVLRQEVDIRWPNRKTDSDGTIGDEAHQNTTSDHNPNSRGSVDAWDMDKDGPDVREVIEAFQRHPSAHYWIWQREIADKDTGWRKSAYTGSNPHTEHAHFSIRQTQSAEQDRRAWGLLKQGEPDVNETQDIRLNATDARLAAIVSMLTEHDARWTPTVGDKEQIPFVKFLLDLDAKVAAADAKVAAVSSGLVSMGNSIGSSLGSLGTVLNTLASRVEELGAADAQRDTEAAAVLAQVQALLQEHSDGTVEAEEIVRRMGELLSAPPEGV